MSAVPAVSPAAPAVEVREIVRRFGPVTAIDGLSFAVGAGELFGLVGPDGAGKTTMLRMLAGVLRPTSGHALLFGHDVAADPERVKPDLAYMSQRFGLYTDLTVQENLDFYADLYQVPERERAARYQRLYHFSNLGPFRGRLAGNLSGGMKQKLGLSCALVHEPRLLLLDEPTFGVDPVSRRDLWVMVHEMVSRGVTAIVSTAYMDEAERFDRLALVHRGRAVAIDTPQALQRTLEGRLLAVRIDRPRQARPQALSLPGVTGVAIFGDQLHLVVDDAGRRAAEVERALRAAGFTVSGSAPTVPGLEDVFIARLGEDAQEAAP